MTSHDAVPKTEMERLWERLKERAASYAASGSLVSLAEAQSDVLAIWDEDEEHISLRRAADTIEYLARELVRLTDEANARARSNR